MRFGVLAGNSAINSRIYEMLDDLHPADVPKIVSKFQIGQEAQRFHTLRELEIGSRLRRQGLALRYELNVEGKSPDWSLVGKQDCVEEILDVVTVHQRRVVDKDIASALSKGEIWSGWISIPQDHIYSKLEQKAQKYSSMVESLRVPYVVAVFGEFTASIDPEEVESVLYSHHGGLFAQVPTVAGVVYFNEECGRYNYFYFPNKSAACPSRSLGPRLSESSGGAA